MNKNEVTELKKVEVAWLDALSDDAHLELDAISDFIPATRTNIGFLLKDDGAEIIITQGLLENVYSGKTLMDGYILIPKGMIEEVKVLND